MAILKYSLGLAAAGLLLAAVALSCQRHGPVKVEIRKKGEGFALYRGGRSYFVKGAVFYGDPKGTVTLASLAAAGANSLRYAGQDDPRPVLDEAQRLGLTVTLNLPMRMEGLHKFDYSDFRKVRAQFNQLEQMVSELKDHPALLMWGVGNELSEGYTNRAVWNAVNEVVQMIHDTDPNHPALTVVSDSAFKAGALAEIRRRCPDLDLLGFNYYQGVERLPALVRQSGWDKPYLLTEWGPAGSWQVAKTRWGAEIEETGSQRADRMLQRYRGSVLADPAHCLGAYAFVWQWRQERTHTWYGLFLEDGERTPAVGVLEYLWRGRWPANGPPRVELPRIDDHVASESVTLKPGSLHRATIKASDPEGDPLSCRWEIRAEVKRAGYAGLGEKFAAPLPGLIKRGARSAEGVEEIQFAAPEKEGPWRLFVFALNGHGHGTPANIPFYVNGAASTAPHNTIDAAASKLYSPGGK